jgi:hypothetical protein
MLKSRATVQDLPEPEPTLESVAPEWVELSGKLRDLLAQEENLLGEIRDLKPAIDKSGLANFRETNVGVFAAAAEAASKPKRMIGPSGRAADILGKHAPAPVPAPEPLSFEPKLAKQMRELGDEVAAVREAIALLHPQVTKAHLEGSKRLCMLLAPEYKKIAGRIYAALVELGNADLEQRAFMLKYRNAARSTLRVVHSTGSLGDPQDKQSELRRLLDWAAECGHFDLSELPSSWDQRTKAQVSHPATRSGADSLSLKLLSSSIATR